MLNLLPISLGVLVLFGSCANMPGPNLEQPISELAVRMERKGCYGRCPMYILDIQPDGSVKFEGKGYTSTVGTVESKLTRDQLQLLISTIRESDFFAFNNSYVTAADGCPTTATDMPTVTLSVRLDRSRKTVSHYHGCLEISEPQPSDLGKVARAEKLQPYPRKLTTLENRIDEIVSTKQWIGDGSD
jgi:hypothetical protein